MIKVTGGEMGSFLWWFNGPDTVHYGTNSNHGEFEAANPWHKLHRNRER